jgi:hypothetical protein
MQRFNKSCRLAELGQAAAFLPIPFFMLPGPASI